MRYAARAGIIAVAVGSVAAVYTAWETRRDARSAQAQPDGGDFFAQFDLSDLQVPREQLLRGGPPKDGIPSLTDPETVPASEAGFLRANDRIVAVEFNDEARAYPMRMLNWHEAVNDTVGGVPIVVVYCPLCDSVTVMDRRMNGDTLTFGISGLLYQSNVLMYDRTHNALWSQILMEAVSGPYAGRSLKHYGWEIASFGDWRERHPEGDVVTFDTGHRRDYDRNPYERYFESDRLFFPVKRDDGRMARKARIIGVRHGDTVRAYPLESIVSAEGNTVEDKIAGERIVLKTDTETGRTAVIEAPDDALVIHTFWFTWAAVHPETEIYGN